MKSKFKNNELTTSKNVQSADYPQFLVEIKERIRKSQYEAVKAVNQEIERQARNDKLVGKTYSIS